MKPYGWRDRAVAWLADKVLRLASRRYRYIVGDSIQHGLRTIASPLLPLPAPQQATDLENSAARARQAITPREDT